MLSGKEVVMENLPWILTFILTLIVLSLLVKIYLLRKSAKEIYVGLADKLKTDTNTLIDISSNDRSMRHLANGLNDQLRKLRSEHHRFQRKDLELKTAITNISHDLRTPLTAVFGYLDLLEQEEKSEAVNHYLEVIRNRAEMLKQLTEELFSFSIVISARSSVRSESIAINGVLAESIAASYVALTDRGITPRIQIPEQDIARQLDQATLSRVFANLLNNALEYSDGDLDISLSEAGEVTFTNSASALDEVQVGKLFDRFYTVETARKSTGLGLAIAKTLVEQMNGTITAQYLDQKLSIFIRFPEPTMKAPNRAKKR
jgi:signal transduction histidine kinase